jgi:DNA repair protein RecO (recombination protein O)
MPKSASSKTYLAHGIVLRVRPLGEKDRQITILTEEHGKIRASARGARNPKSKLSAITQPFVKAHFALAHGRSFEILTQAQITTLHQESTSDVVKIAWASYLCELCDSLPENMPTPEMYLMLETAMERLASAKSTFDQEVIGHWFESCFLASQGYSPTIGFCMLCECKISVHRDEYEKRIPFSVLHGGTICQSCLPDARGVIKVPVHVLRVLHHFSLSEMPPLPERAGQILQIDSAILWHLRDILRLCIEQHPEIHTRSRSFLAEILAETLV